MKTVNIFLDDLRQPHEAFHYTKNPIYKDEEWLVVTNHRQFHNAILEIFGSGAKMGIVSFDHDLAPEHYAPADQYDRYNEWSAEQEFQEKTGYDCLNWLLDFCSNENLRRPTIVFHTMNPVGKENMRQLLATKKHR